MKNNVGSKQKFSKNTKHSWRKHIDIKDVESFLEDKRLEERLGIPFSLRSNDELFVLDGKPDAPVELSAKQKKRLLLKSTPAKCFAVLTSQSKVDDPISKRNRVRTCEERRHPIAKLNDKAKILSGKFKLKDINAIKNRAKTKEAKAAVKVIRGEVKHDLWSAAEDNNPASAINLTSSWIDRESVLHTLRNTGKHIKLMPKSIHTKKSALKTIEIPHPGTSYNPRVQDHQDLLRSVAENELKIIKEEEHLDRVTSQFTKVTMEQNNSSWITEMSEGLPNKNGTAEESGSDGEYTPINPAVINKKKSIKQRRKQREQRDLKVALKAAKINKKKIADIYKLRFINKNIEEAEEKHRNTKVNRDNTKALKPFQTKLLGPMKFKEPDLNFNMYGDIAGNLRNIKTEGSILTDRFKSLQKRNILQPTKSQGVRKKPKVKSYMKNSHKDNW